MFSLFKNKTDIELRRKLLRFINEQNRAAATCYEDHRDESRSILSLSVLIVPLDAGEPIVSKARPAIARDISTTGIGIIAPVLIEFQKAIVVLPRLDEDLFVEVEVLHNRSMGLGFSVLGTRITRLVEWNEFPVLEDLGAAMKQLYTRSSHD